MKLHSLTLLIAMMSLYVQGQTGNATSAQIINGGCLTDPNFCLNMARCGINGNCICPSYFYGQRCESQITQQKRVTLREMGIG